MLQHVVGKICLAEQLRLFVAKAQSLPDQFGVVVLAAATDRGRTFPHLPPDAFIMQVLHDGNHGWSLQSEAVFGRVVRSQAFCKRIRARRIDRRLRQSRELPGIVDDEIPLVGGIQDILRILLGDLRKLGLQFLQALFLVRRQFGARLPEAVHRLLQGAFFHASQRACGVGFAVGHQQIPQRFVE